MKKLLLLILVFCAAQAAFAQKEYGIKFSSLINDELTLENAIRLGLENNTDFLTDLATDLQDGIRHAVKVAAELGYLQKEILRHFHVALSQRSAPPSLPAPQCTSHAPLHPPRTQYRSDSHRK